MDRKSRNCAPGRDAAENFNLLASRADCPLDLKAEEDERSNLKHELLGFDPSKGVWTAANGLSRRIAESKKITKDLKVYESGKLIDVFDELLARVTFVAGGTKIPHRILGQVKRCGQQCGWRRIFDGK
eukprot:1593528-Amphidinium_carterae.1